MSTALQHLAHRLRVPVDQVPVLGEHDEARILAYEKLVHRAMDREGAALTHALEEALTFVPRLLRPVAKKLLGGAHE
ncbi:hypothetical protein [Nocardioides sp. Iso805N]|uniref:hypothetical protein n=1 Tax=Nocardioides sp. Iso805N TaxID=1283287 RepID=UPI00035E7662|nr:hypothetical protein [Nocardioides sp. Iso805N]